MFPAFLPPEATFASRPHSTPQLPMSASASSSSVFPSAPFDGEHADIILRSAQGDDFRVYKVILREASPVFRDMLALPQPKPQRRSEINDDGLPTITVTESSRALDNLLRICYPIPSPEITDIREIEEVLEAALKYDVKLAIGEMRRALKGCCNAVGVFAVACLLKWEDEARQAAYELLKEPFGPFHPSLGRISAAVYHGLFEYHQKVSKKVAALFDDPLGTDKARSPFTCPAQHRGCSATGCYDKNKNITWSAWWLEYVRNVRARVLEAPLCEDIYDPAFILQCVADASGVCYTCKTDGLKKWLEATRYLKAMRDHSVSKITIDLSSAGIPLTQKETWDDY
ncbi:hypothetical protein BD410DRAFT_836571 [Rickenella mellea]|uniref:BTB domain-containing protein n=1 Tax=Rickenella mellea TaxID=50990 RepID=A0A4Y7QHL2_9AGAM|nr:hypothetical protein BD410DRAFT_836571 [Rickenella mellea]